MYCYTHNQVSGPAFHMAVAKQSIRSFKALLSAASENIDGLDCCGESPLSFTIAHKFEPFTELLLDKNVNINFKNKKGDTLLHYCAHTNNVRIARILLGRGAPVDVENCDKNTPLHVAVEYCADMELLELLISAGANLEHKNNIGQTALFLAVRGDKYDDICKFLINKGAEVNVRDNNNWMPLHIAVQYKHLRGCELLLDGGAELNISDGEGNTLLHRAISLKSYSVVKFLTDKGACIERENRSGENELLHAMRVYFQYKTKVWKNLKVEEAENDCKLIVDLLLKMSVDVNVRDKAGNSPLYYALYTADESFVKAIVNKRNADVKSKSKDGSTPLHVAALMNVDTSIIELLIFLGANVNTKDRMGLSPLHCAAVTAQSVENLDCLLQNGAKVNAKDSLGRTPLHWAVGKYECKEVVYNWPKYITLFFKNIYVPCSDQSSNAYQVVEKLLDSGANVNVKDSEMLNTPLLTAVYTLLEGKPPQAVYEQIILELIERGASMEETNKYKDFPLTQLALSSSLHSNECKSLKEHIVKLYCAKLIQLEDEYDLCFGDIEMEIGRDFKKACYQEWMKVQVGIIDGHRLCDLFSQSLKPRFVFSKAFTQEVLSAKFENSYPLYAPILRKALKKAQRKNGCS